jgi:hypothetical protein
MRILARPSGYAAALLLAGAAGLALPTMASAAIQPPPNVVCSSSDLVAAIQHANSVGSATLLLAGNCNYALTAAASGNDGLPAITGNITLTGAQGTTISRSAGSAFRIIEVARGGSLTLSGVTVTNGLSGSTGGGIQDSGTLSLQNVRLTGNTAGFGGGALAVAPGARATVGSSSLTGNSTRGAGGGILNQGTLSLQDDTLSGNTAAHGGAIDNAGQFSADDSTLTGNSARLNGGGLNTDGPGSSQISGTSVDHNRAGAFGGGISNQGRTALFGGRVVFNHAFVGGGIVNVPRGSVSLRGTFVAFNSPDNCRPRGTIRGCMR